MAFSKNRLHELEIACAILRTNIRALGDKWDISDTWVRSVAKGEGQSDRIEEKISDLITKAQSVVPFSYSYEVTSEVTDTSSENPISKAI